MSRPRPFALEADIKMKMFRFDTKLYAFVKICIEKKFQFGNSVIRFHTGLFLMFDNFIPSTVAVLGGLIFLLNFKGALFGGVALYLRGLDFWGGDPIAMEQG